MPVFLEKFVIPAFVAGLGYLLYQSRYDWPSKISLSIALIAIAYFVAHSIEARKHSEGYQTTEKDNAAAAHKTSSFVGRVTTKAGSGISNALVIVQQDESIGQSMRTDINGQFQVFLPGDTKSLRLIVNADGYLPATVQANVDRTGPEEVTLQQVPPKKLKTPTTPDAKTPPPSPPPSLVTQVPTNNTGIIINAPNFGNQSNIINPPPPVPEPPKVWFSQQPYTESMNLNPSIQEPISTNSVLLKIGVDKFFDEPIFYIDCDSPCSVGKPLLGRRSGSRESLINSLHISRQGSTKDSMHHMIAFEERLSPTSFAALRVQFFKSSGKVLAVSSIAPTMP